MDRRRLTVIFIIVFVNFLGGTIVLPTLPLYAQSHFDASPELITLLNSSFFLAQFLAGPLLGRWSDRYGRVPVLVISLLGTVVSFIMMGTAQSLAMLFAARVLDGITGGNVIVAQAYITDITPREQRTRALGLVFMAFGLGFIFGPGLGGTLAAFLGERAPFWVGAALTFMTVLLTMFVLNESLTAEERTARRALGRKMAAADITGNIPLLLILLIGFGAQFSFALFQSSFSLFGAAVLFPGYSTQDASLGVGLLLSGIGIGQFVTQLWLIQPLVRRYGERRLVIIGDLLRAFGVLTLVVFTSPWLVGPISLIAFAVGSGLMMPSLQSLATVTVPDELRGGVLGIYQSATSLGVILGSALSGVLFASAPTMPFLVGGILFMVMLFPGVLLSRRVKTPAVAAPA